MAIVDDTQTAVELLIFEETGRKAMYKATPASVAEEVTVLFQPLGRTTTDYGEAYYASIDILRKSSPTRPPRGATFTLADEDPQTWAVTSLDEGQSAGQTRFAWSVFCVGEEGRRLSTGHMERF